MSHADTDCSPTKQAGIETVTLRAEGRVAGAGLFKRMGGGSAGQQAEKRNYSAGKGSIEGTVSNWSLFSLDLPSNRRGVGGLRA